MRKLPRFRITAATLALAFALGAAGIASAQAPGLVAPVPQDTGRLYGFGGLAAFGPEKNSGLANERGTLSNFIGGAGYHAWPNWAVEANVLIDTRKLDTPAGVVAQLPAGAFQPGTAKSTISSSGLAVSAKYRFSGGPLVPYLGGGMGLYTTRFSTTTEE